MSDLKDETINLIVTSPPYPMIEMWDEIMSKQNPAIFESQKQNRSNDAFELMHRELDKVWKECFRVLANGGFLCINVGDATRTINGEFKLYNNHSRISTCCSKLGFNELPCILWRKETNAPNKFMGSGMLPNGAYVTLEHEYILIFRKGTKRDYKKDLDKNLRKDSAFFWEERNLWFSDIWTFKGAKQSMSSLVSRERNGSFPLELPYRIINMYSQKGDIVLDPFMGLGTSLLAAIFSNRNSLGFEIDKEIRNVIKDRVLSVNIDQVNSFIKQRFDRHMEFVENREKKQGKEMKHFNSLLDCKVMTKQEESLSLNYIKSISCLDDKNLFFEIEYFNKSNLRELPFVAQRALF